MPTFLQVGKGGCSSSAGVRWVKCAAKKNREHLVHRYSLPLIHTHYEKNPRRKTNKMLQKGNARKEKQIITHVLKTNKWGNNPLLKR